MKLRIYSIIWLILLLASSCTEEVVQTYTGVDGINLFVLVNDKQASTATLPLGFLDDSVADSTVYLVADVQGNVSNNDRTIELEVPDSLKALDMLAFEFPKKVVLPAGAYTVKFPLKVKREALNSYSNGLNIVLNLKINNDFVAGVYHSATITATNFMPSQWIGYTYYFPSYFGTCSKTKYRFVYATLGIYDFTSVGYNFNALSVYRSYLNTKLDEYEQLHGSRLWDEDLNKNVSFP